MFSFFCDAAILAADALKDVFMNTLLPDRKLVHLADQPLTDSTPSDAQLLMWAYEDHLKRAYFLFLQALEVRARPRKRFGRHRTGRLADDSVTWCASSL